MNSADNSSTSEDDLLQISEEESNSDSGEDS